VATGEADISFGTDAGGSIRIPAACCGVGGLKTTFGRVSALTAPVNLAGLAALALPVPAAVGAIASLQVIGSDEETVLAFGRIIEAAIAG
jgi:amidase